MPSQTKSLDLKLQRIQTDPLGAKDFILADAKDADMAFGVTAPGPKLSHEKFIEGVGPWKSLADYRDQIREVVRQGLVDIMLLSASNLEQLAITERLFVDSCVTPAARANDTTDIWAVRGGKYTSLPSRPFRTAFIEHIKYGRLDSDCTQPHLGADLGLYSITLNNNLDCDIRTLEEFRAFRQEAELKRFRYFLEVFNPNVDSGLYPREVGSFLNDHIVRALAGVPKPGRPLFLKIAYKGAAAMEELAAYDPSLVIGILGGSAGTTMDAFMLLHEARKRGARAALFGRKINLSEHPLSFIEHLHRLAKGEMVPADAVRSYHDALRKLHIKPRRDLVEDMRLTDSLLTGISP